MPGSEKELKKGAESIGEQTRAKADSAGNKIEDAVCERPSWRNFHSGQGSCIRLGL